ncbi:MAG: CvpA family protein [Treponema sp.]|jgi:membrane protein required for colicin V production|nr:CvpA family protein [Treponema sp.]
MTSFKLIDYVFFGLTLLLVIRCTLRGFIAEFMTLASLVLGALGSLFLYRPCAAFLRDHGLRTFTGNLPSFIQKLLPALVQNIPEILAFVLIFIVIFFAVKLVEYLLKDIIQRISLGGVDRFLGFLFGMVEGIMITSLLLLFLSIQPVFNAAPLLEGSFFAEILLPLIGRRGSPESVLSDGLTAVAAGLLCSRIS